MLSNCFCGAVWFVGGPLVSVKENLNATAYNDVSDNSVLQPYPTPKGRTRTLTASQALSLNISGRPL